MSLHINWLKNKTILWVYCISVILMQSCEKDPKIEEEKPNTFAQNRALILNEGSLGNGNASISLLNLDNYTVQHNVFKSINGTEIGDILQSAIVYHDRIYLCVTNSNIIRVLDKFTLKQIKTISINGPRYIQLTKNNLAYISGYNNHVIYVFDLATDKIIQTIPMPFKHIERIHINDNKAYVCNWDENNNHLYIVDVNHHSITDSIALAGYAPHNIVRDKHERMWVFSGNKNLNIAASISIINNNHQLVKSYTFDATHEVVKPIYDSLNDDIYYISIDYAYRYPQGIYKMKATDNQLPTQAFIPADNYQYFYSIQLDEKKNEFLISDPKGFIQRGDIIRYDRTGQKLGIIEANIGPNGVLFID